MPPAPTFEGGTVYSGPPCTYSNQPVELIHNLYSH